MNLFDKIYYLFISLFLVFPSSFLGSLKTLVFLILILATIIAIGKHKVSIKDVFILLGVVIGLTIHLIIGALKDTIIMNQGLMAFRAFITFFILLFVTYYFGKKNIIDFRLFFRVVFYSVLVYLIGKLLLIFYIITGGVSVLNLKDAMPGMVIQQFYGNAYLTRIVSATDIVNVFLFAFIVIVKDTKAILNTKLFKLYFVLSIIMMVQSYTRYIWAILVLILIFKLFFLSKNRIRNIIYSSISLLVLSVMSIILIPNEVNLLIELLNIKFSDTASLSVKSIQADYLLNEFIKHPILGKGLGAYVEYYIRDNKQLFQYETQIFAFLMQFGIIGFFIFCSPMISIIMPYCRSNKVYMTLGMLYLLWLLSGFTNPYLTVLACVPIYGLFMLYPMYLNKKHNNLEI